MTEQLRTAVAAVEQLPEETQNEIAALILSEMQWEKAFHDPRHDATLDRMEAEVCKHIAAGEVYPMPGEDE